MECIILYYCPSSLRHTVAIATNPFLAVGLLLLAEGVTNAQALVVVERAGHSVVFLQRVATMDVELQEVISISNNRFITRGCRLVAIDISAV